MERGYIWREGDPIDCEKWKSRVTFGLGYPTNNLCLPEAEGFPGAWVIRAKTRTKVKVSVAQSCPTLYDPRDCSLPGSSVHGILQARIMQWVAIPFAKRSFPPQSPRQIRTVGHTTPRFGGPRNGVIVNWTIF